MTTLLYIAIALFILCIVAWEFVKTMFFVCVEWAIWIGMWAYYWFLKAYAGFMKLLIYWRHGK